MIDILLSHLWLLGLALKTTVFGVVAGLLGPFVLWRRLAFLSESISHGGALGAFLAIVLGLPISLVVMGFSTCMVLVLLFFRDRLYSSNDSLLSLMAHFLLAFGILLLSLQDGGLFATLNKLLLGEDIAVLQSARDAISADFLSALPMLLLLVFLLLALWRFGDALILSALSPQMAKLEGFSVVRYEFFTLIAIAAVVSLSMEEIGILLITALFMVPSTTARLITHSPQMMMMVSAILGGISAFTGVFVSEALSLPVSASVVGISAFFLAATYLLRALSRALPKYAYDFIQRR